MSQPANYYSHASAPPILCLLVDDYVFEVGEPNCKPRTRYHGVFVPLVEEKPTLSAFYDEVCDRAEQNMASTGTVGGAHWNAMRVILAAKGIEVTR